LMNGKNSEQWILTQLFPNLERPSVFIIDYALYHSVLLEKPPTQTWRKNEVICLAARATIQSWITETHCCQHIFKEDVRQSHK
jgi:hypothetical protein